MSLTDILYVFQWWLMLLVFGVLFFPFSASFFKNFLDKGYIFAKILGIGVISYVIFVLGTYHVVSFTYVHSIFILFLIGGLFFVIGVFRLKLFDLKKSIFLFILEEIIFLISLFFWVFIKAHQPDIRGLEKFMDFGFINSILRSSYFPARDMWFTPFTINYYYFGHLVTAVLTKLSNIPSAVTFNLMLCTIFAFCFTASFSMGLNLFFTWAKHIDTAKKIFRRSLFCGFLTAILVTFAGNLHSIYVFFQPYQTTNPLPFWQLPISLWTLPNSYWYPNATRFIFNTIHEFPIYSFVVSDLHGHVLDIPFVLFILALLFSILNKHFEYRNKYLLFNKIQILIPAREIILISFSLAILNLTNAMDGIIYFLLTSLLIFFLSIKKTSARTSLYSFLEPLKTFLVTMILIGICYFLFSLPFTAFFSPFVSGIGVLCAPSFLTAIQKLGPFLFEENHCQASPWWQLIILHGFFYFWVISFGVLFSRRKKLFELELNPASLFVLLSVFLSTLLIIIPEFVYAKDIYPAHYRANTMFKLVYQSFIMLSLASGFIIVRIIVYLKSLSFFSISIFKKFLISYYVVFGSFLIIMVLSYPYFAVNSYFENLKNYYGLNGLSYFKKQYPSDYAAILWLQKNIQNQPVILEAQGDSYTDYARVSANTGLPTVLGWTVHEWLWRKTYDVPAPRIPEVQTLYESSNLEATQNLIKKYSIEYVFIGDLERQKYTNFNEDKFNDLGSVVFKNGRTKIYKIK